MMQFPVGNTLFVVLEPGNIRKMREGQPLVLRPKPGTTSIGIVSTPDIIELRRRIQLPTSPEMLSAAIESCKDLPEVDRGAEPVTAAVTAAENTENQIALQVAGSAETGGEKAAPGLPQTAEGWHEFYTNKIRSHAWVTGVRAKDWGDGSFEDVLAAYAEAYVVWHAEFANFHRSSQNQTVSSGVEGAQEGTTADKKGDSREPEKLNNAHNFKQLLQELVSVQAPYDHDDECSFCGSMEGKEHHEECSYRKAKVALAESSLSSTPPEEKK